MYTGENPIVNVSSFHAGRNQRTNARTHMRNESTSDATMYIGVAFQTAKVTTLNI